MGLHTFRFIPTYVGHTLDAAKAANVRSVHPHIRGAYMGRPAKIYVKNGSSPHTWGIRCDAGQTSARSRFIPTYVGHTSCIFVTHVGAPVHPHIRGAYASARRWGKLSRRFIPTYVGHTSCWYCRIYSNTIHPHIRGAYGLPHSAFYSRRGSSPHTWGIHSWW